LQFYIRTREFGTSPHAGFGVGFDRLIMLLTGYVGFDNKPDIRETIAYPRQSGDIIC
jgi:asparaginyl-tRNA synthetase